MQTQTTRRKFFLYLIGGAVLFVVGVGIPFLLIDRPNSHPETLGAQDQGKEVSQYDLNLDGKIDQSDLQSWLEDYRQYQEAEIITQADFNQDGRIDAADSRLLVVQLRDSAAQ